uniref:Tumor necrosis factor ligand superfamily member 10 n=1 Tax=Castor canadensis TaxID=51338 RepID=A0A8B7U579_CASCN|nr:tumor necrosis factor ligand superfamily member 10-like [Castor canadensis]
MRQSKEENDFENFEESTPTAQEKRQSSSFPARETRPQRIAAHITGTISGSNLSTVSCSENGTSLGQKMQSWESSRKGYSFLSNLHLRNGELVIHQTGLYYIYSQIYFRFQELEKSSKKTSKEENRKKNKQMVQYIYKCTSYPDPILLMKSARSSCWSTNLEYGLYSIYQGGVFELKENDRIFVSVTNKDLVNLDQEASFFGAFLVG